MRLRSRLITLAVELGIKHEYHHHLLALRLVDNSVELTDGYLE